MHAMSDSPKQSERPTLPSLQDLFPDEQFERLRLESIDSAQRPSATANPAPPLVRDPDSRSAPSRLRSRSSPSPTNRPIPRSPVNPAHRPRQPAPYSLPRHHPSPNPISHLPNPARPGSSLHGVSPTDLPTYVLSADECPPDDDRRHGCGICHRRFNRPSSLMIHMNSHTGAQPFECPFPGCTRRFSVNSNMRRHYRNHRDAAGGAPSAQIQPYPPTYYRTADPAHTYYSPGISSPSSSSQSSFDGDDRPDLATAGSFRPEDQNQSHVYALPQAHIRTRSEVFPPPARRDERPVSRPRACTVPGCNCNEAPSALRPAAFQQGSSSRFSPRHR